MKIKTLQKNCIKFDDFGCHINCGTIGETWINLVKAVRQYGEESLDENRKRLALMNVRVKADKISLNDEIIYKYSDLEKCKAMIDFTFSKPVIEDIDVKKSFKKGAKSYHQRIKEGNMVEFVIKRLSLIPESKKAVISFPLPEDYHAIFKDHYENDYLPCIVTIQFRLVPNEEGYVLNTNFYSRSIDSFQKAHGNLLSIAILSKKIGEEIEKNLGKKITLGFIDGMIADAHIYEECFNETKEMLKRYENEN